MSKAHTGGWALRNDVWKTLRPCQEQSPFLPTSWARCEQMHPGPSVPPRVMQLGMDRAWLSAPGCLPQTLAAPVPSDVI